MAVINAWIVNVRRGVVAVLLFGITACAGSGATVDERVTRFEAAILPPFLIRGEAPATRSLAQAMAEDRVPGLSITVFREGRIEWSKGYGVADVETGVAVTPATRFQAASISKPVAALAALQLADQGLINLDEAVNGKLRSWQIPANTWSAEHPVTLRHLLSHQGGTTVHGFGGYAEGEAIPTAVGVLDGDGNSPPVVVDQQPGTAWRYSGGGYTVVQQLVSDMRGQPFATVMEERVLRPLAMRDSTYEQPLPPEYHAGSARGHRANGALIPGRWHTYPEQAAAGLWTTPRDLARYALAVRRAWQGHGQTVLSPSMAQEMLTPQRKDWGLGPTISAKDGRYGHGGSNAGFKCVLVAYLETGDGAVVMTNSDNGGALANQVIATLAREYGWPGLDPEEKVIIRLTPEQYEAVCGTYLFQGTVEVTVTYEDGRLLVHSPNSTEGVEILPETPLRFVARQGGRVVQFEEEDGRVRRVQAGPATGVRVDDEPVPEEAALEPVAIEEVEVASLQYHGNEEHLPEVVGVRLAELALLATARLQYALDQKDELIWEDELLRLNIPRQGRMPLQLFVSHLPTVPLHSYDRALLVHDPESDRVTVNPLIFSGQWLGPKGVHPRLVDLDRDGMPEIVYRDFLHNGTMENIEQAVFVSIGEDLSLTEVLRVRVSEMDLYSRGEWGVIRSRLFRPSVSANGSTGDLLVLQSWKENPRFGPEREVLDPVSLVRDPVSGVWRDRSNGSMR